MGPDTDQDGIPDTFEMNEIRDKNGNVIADLKAMGADPCRKTIAVEVDYMGGAADGHTHKFDPNAITEAVTMFDNAPVPASVSCPYAGYPKKPTGIDLLVKVDEQIPESNPFGCGDFNDAFKAAHFNPVLSGIFHYNLWVHDHDASSSGGIACGGGKGDYLVSLGSWCTTVDPPYCTVATQNGDQRDQAGTFNHELGHVLSLGHGGGDVINFKPNYLRIMNYEWEVTGLTDSATGITRLDFSHSALPTLNEQSLSDPLV